jgi:hypothetical protein
MPQWRGRNSRILETPISFRPDHRKELLMKLGLLIPLISRYATPQVIRALGTTAERLGFSTIWVGEHSVMFDEQESKYPMAESLGTDGKMLGTAFRISRSCSNVARLAHTTDDGSRQSKRTFTSVGSVQDSDLYVRQAPGSY